MEDDILTAPPGPPVRSALADALARVEDAAERAREAAERATQETASLADRLDRRLDDLGKSFVDHSHIPVITDAADQAIDVATEIPSDVADTAAETSDALLSDAPTAPERIPDGKRRRNPYRLR